MPLGEYSSREVFQHGEENDNLREIFEKNGSFNSSKRGKRVTKRSLQVKEVEKLSTTLLEERTDKFSKLRKLIDDNDDFEIEDDNCVCFEDQSRSDNKMSARRVEASSFEINDDNIISSNLSIQEVKDSKLQKAIALLQNINKRKETASLKHDLTQDIDENFEDSAIRVNLPTVRRAADITNSLNMMSTLIDLERDDTLTNHITAVVSNEDKTSDASKITIKTRLNGSHTKSWIIRSSDKFEMVSRSSREATNIA
jgi:hypothetical protein